MGQAASRQEGAPPEGQGIAGEGQGGAHARGGVHITEDGVVSGIHRNSRHGDVNWNAQQGIGSNFVSLQRDSVFGSPEPESEPAPPQEWTTSGGKISKNEHLWKNMVELSKILVTSARKNSPEDIDKARDDFVKHLIQLGIPKHYAWGLINRASSSKKIRQLPSDLEGHRDVCEIRNIANTAFLAQKGYEWTIAAEALAEAHEDVDRALKFLQDGWYQRRRRSAHAGRKRKKRRKTKKRKSRKSKSRTRRKSQKRKSRRR